MTGLRLEPRPSELRLLSRWQPSQLRFSNLYAVLAGPGIAASRLWVRSQRAALQCAIAFVMVAGIVGLFSYVTWHHLAGEQLRLAPERRTPDTTLDTSIVKTQVRKQPATLETSLERSTPTTPAAATATTSPPSTMSGTTLALALITLMTGSAVMVQRRLLRWYRAHTQLAGVATTLQTTHAESASVATDSEPDGPAAPGDIESSTRAGTGDTPGDAEDESSDGHADETEPEREPMTSGDPTAAAGEQHVTVPEGADGLSWGEAVTGARFAPHHAGGPTAPSTAGRSSTVLFDRRTAHRIIYETSARLQWNAHDVAATTLNLSTVGMACRVREAEAILVPRAGTAVQVTLTLNESLATLDARVRWHRVEDDHLVVGLELQGLQSHHRSLLNAVVSRGERG